MTQSAAIVCTLRNAAPVLDSFIRYHRGVGFERLYLFFDDSSDPAVDIARLYPEVTLVLSDTALRARWQQSRYARARGHLDDVDREVMTRQILNVEVAAGMAVADGIDWLLHIDVDELFYCHGTSVGEHFQRQADRGLARVAYRNHEGVPEQADVVDYFREVTLFKRNPSLWGDLRLRPGQRALLAAAPQIPPKYFHFYANGKAAARVHPGLWTRSVHDFELEQGAAVGLAGNDPVILHYPCCGFTHFHDKYRTLGLFPDSWFGTDDIRAAIGSLHLDARDVVAGADLPTIREFYERRMVFGDGAVVAQLLAAGVFLRIDAAANALKS